MCPDARGKLTDTTAAYVEILKSSRGLRLNAELKIRLV
jgi:hypothetical protein